MLNCSIKKINTNNQFCQDKQFEHENGKIIT